MAYATKTRRVVQAYKPLHDLPGVDNPYPTVAAGARAVQQQASGTQDAPLAAAAGLRPAQRVEATPSKVSQLLGVGEGSTASVRRLSRLMDLADPRHLGDALFPPLGLARHYGAISQEIIDEDHRRGSVPGGPGAFAGRILDGLQTGGLGPLAALIGGEETSPDGAWLNGIAAGVGNLEEKLPGWMNIHRR